MKIRLVYYAGLYTVSAGLLKLTGFLLFLWLARTLSVDNYANFGLLYALQTGLTTFGLVGIVEAVVGLLKGRRSAEEQGRLFAAANGVFLVTLSASVAFVISLFVIFDNRSGASFLILTGVLISGGVLAFSSLQSQIARLEEKHLSSLCYSFVLPLAGLVGSFISFFLERTVQSFFLGSAFGLLIALAGLRITRVGFYTFSGLFGEVRPLLLRVTPFIAVAFLGWLSGYGNNYIIKLLFKSKEVARFTFALSLSSVMLLIATALNQVWSPRFYRITHELPFDQVEKKNRQFYRLQGLALGIIGGIVIAVFPFTMKLLGGNLMSYQSMSVELLCLFSAYVFSIPWWHCSNYYLAYGKGTSIMRITLVASAIGFFAWIILMWLLGPIGIYIGFLSFMISYSVVALFAVKRHWPVKASWDGVVGGVLIIFIGFVVSKI